MNCPVCNSEMKVRKGQKGNFWGCSKYPNCRGTVNIPIEGDLTPQTPLKTPVIAKNGGFNEAFKQKLIVRQNTYAHATEIVKHTHITGLSDQDTMLEIIKRIAHEIEKDIYRIEPTKDEMGF